MASNIEEINGEDDNLSSNDLFNIVSWGADLSIREIKDNFKDGDFIKPSLQRNYVWDKKEASRFIESILLGLPVPSIFLANLTDDRKLIVDGYQRIQTISDFFEERFSKDDSVFKLDCKDINERWKNCTFSNLSSEDQRRFKQYLLHAIIFEQKTPKDDSGIFQIFERINSSGKVLNAQEIRNCIFQGDLNNILNELNKNEDWRFLFGDIKEDSRMKDIEFILRFFTLSSDTVLQSQQPQVVLKKELNDYMKRHISMSNIDKNKTIEKFLNSVSYLKRNLGEHAFHNLEKDTDRYRSAFHPTIYDSIMIATSIALERNVGDIADLSERKVDLLRDEDYKSVITQGTMRLQSIKTRISKALSILFNIEDYEQFECRTDA